jgi:DNA-binding LacI/PurR family transcriptional regulator
MELALAARVAEDAVHPMETALASAGRAADTLPPPSKQVSVREVAQLAKVSVATVSLVINENPRISTATKKRVRRVMQELGYRPNRLAQNLSRRDTQMIAVILPSLGHAFADKYFGELLSGICERARKLNHKVMLEQATPEFIQDRQHIDLFERRFVDGALCLGNSDRHPFLTDFAAANFPMLVVNNYFPQWDLEYAVCDYRGGAEQAMNYLLQLGHRRIGMITGSTWVRTARDIVEVYEQKLRAARVQPDPNWQEDGLFTEAGGAGAAQKLLERDPSITALFAANDKMAIGAMHYLHQVGVRVPQDISVIGFDDMQDSAFVNPGLSTVHLPLYEVGVLACERLVNRIRGEGERVQAVLPTHLVVRNSTAIAKSTTSVAMHDDHNGHRGGIATVIDGISPTPPASHSGVRDEPMPPQ